MNAGDGAWLEVWRLDLVAGEPGLGALDREHGLLAVETGHGELTPEARRIGDRKRIARIALRALLAGHVGVELARRPFAIVAGTAGKPQLDAMAGGKLLEFSLAHCDSTALIAICNSGVIGVDIEAIRPVRINAERRAMLERAAAALSPSEPLPDGPEDRRFLQAWVRLEALAKATGEGVSALFGRLGVRGHSLLAPRQDDPTASPMLVRDLRLDGNPSLHAAVAGVSPLLREGTPRPLVQILPLEIARLDAMVRGRTLGTADPWR